MCFIQLVRFWLKCYFLLLCWFRHVCELLLYLYGEREVLETAGLIPSLSAIIVLGPVTLTKSRRNPQISATLVLTCVHTAEEILISEFVFAYTYVSTRLATLFAIRYNKVQSTIITELEMSLSKHLIFSACVWGQ